jgi:hypothetical protein
MLGGPAEVQVFGDRDEVAQLAEVDVSHDYLPFLIPPRYDRRANRSWTGARRYRTVEDMSTSRGEIMPEELLIKGGHVVTVDPGLGDLPRVTSWWQTAASLLSARIWSRRPGDQEGQRR